MRPAGEHNELLDLEELSEQELEQLRSECEEVARQARARKRGSEGGGTPAFQAG